MKIPLYLITLGLIFFSCSPTDKTPANAELPPVPTISVNLPPVPSVIVNPPSFPTTNLSLDNIFVKSRADLYLSVPQNSTKFTLIKTLSSSNCQNGQCIKNRDNSTVQFSLTPQSSQPVDLSISEQNLANILTLQVGTLLDNSIDDCGGKKCSLAFLRVYTTDDNNTIQGAGLFDSTSGISIPLMITTSSSILGSTQTLPIPYNPTDASLIVDQLSIPANQEVISLANGDFSDASSVGFPIAADFSQASSGTYKAHIVIEYDLFAPLTIQTTITGSSLPISGLTNQTSATFDFVSNVAGTTFNCSLDSGSSTPCVSGQTYSNLADGSHTFAVSGPNDTEAPATASWSISTMPAVLVTVPSPVNTFGVTENSIVATWTTNIPTTTFLNYGPGVNTGNQIIGDQTFQTSHTITITGLTNNSVYSYLLQGVDAYGNTFRATRRVIKTLP